MYNFLNYREFYKITQILNGPFWSKVQFLPAPLAQDADSTCTTNISIGNYNRFLRK